jgi:hypothetical protein
VCVNGPGESKAANIGISLPGTGEAPHCPVYVDGEHVTTLRGTYEELATGIRTLIVGLRGFQVSAADVGAFHHRPPSSTIATGTSYAQH